MIVATWSIIVRLLWVPLAKAMGWVVRSAGNALESAVNHPLRIVRRFERIKLGVMLISLTVVEMLEFWLRILWPMIRELFYT